MQIARDRNRPSKIISNWGFTEAMNPATVMAAGRCGWRKCCCGPGIDDRADDGTSERTLSRKVDVRIAESIHRLIEGCGNHLCNRVKNRSSHFRIHWLMRQGFNATEVPNIFWILTIRRRTQITPMEDSYRPQHGRTLSVHTSTWFQMRNDAAPFEDEQLLHLISHFYDTLAVHRERRKSWPHLS